MEQAKTTTTPNYIVKDRIKPKEKLSYMLGDVASLLVFSSTNAFAMYYYTNSVGMAAAAIGTMFLISRLLDGFSDIIMGLIIDRTHTKYGKARPWLLWCAIPFGAAAVLMFSVPMGWSDGAKLIYAYVTYNLLLTGVYTAINIAYGTLNVLITDNEKDRASLSIYRLAGGIVTGTLVAVALMPLVNALGGDARAWTVSFIILGIVAVILFLLCFFGVRERVGSAQLEKSVAHKQKVPVKIAITALVTNKFWYNRTFFNLCLVLATSTSSANVYYAAYWLGNDNLTGMLTLVNTIPMFIALFLSSALVGRMSKRNLCLLGIGLGLGGTILQVLSPGNLVLVLIGHALRGISIAPMSAVGSAMSGDVIDYGEWKAGVRTESLVFSAASFGSKVGAGLGSAILGWALAIGGFNAAVSTQTPAAMNSIIAVFIFVPLILYVVMGALTGFYSLDKKMPQIREDLARRRAAKAEADNIAIEQI